MQVSDQPVPTIDTLSVSNSEPSVADLIAEQNAKTVASLPLKNAKKASKPVKAAPTAKPKKATPAMKPIPAIKPIAAAEIVERNEPAYDFIPLDPYDSAEPPKQP
jgi:hypothetical protein